MLGISRMAIYPVPTFLQKGGFNYLINSKAPVIKQGLSTEKYGVTPERLERSANGLKGHCSTN